MASQHIELAGEVRLQSKLRSAIDRLNNVRGDIAIIREIADKASNGADWAGFEAAFGLPAGKGQQVYNFLVATDTALNTGDVATFASALG